MREYRSSQNDADQKLQLAVRDRKETDAIETGKEVGARTVDSPVI